MKDFISKVTFGFLMAQLLPGAVVVFSVSCVVKVDSHCRTEAFLPVLKAVGEAWFTSTFTAIAFLFLATGTGMFLHGLNWAVLAWLENEGNIRGYSSLRDWPWHKWPLWLQLVASPFVMIYEVLHMVLLAPNIEKLTMEENAPEINDNRMGQFAYLQEFYLYFGQFYSHMAYAILISIPFWRSALRTAQLQPSLVRLVGLVLYFLSSAFFLLGRIQLGTMFKAERTLRKMSLTDRNKEGKARSSSRRTRK